MPKFCIISSQAGKRQHHKRYLQAGEVAIPSFSHEPEKWSAVSCSSLPSAKALRPRPVLPSRPRSPGRPGEGAGRTSRRPAGGGAPWRGEAAWSEREEAQRKPRESATSLLSSHFLHLAGEEERLHALGRKQHSEEAAADVAATPLSPRASANRDLRPSD